LELSMTGTKQRCGGKHRYSRKLSKNYRQYEAKENAGNKKILFQGSFENNHNDNLEDKSRKDMDDVAYGLENLKLQGEVSSQVNFDVKDDWSDTEHSSSPQVSSDLSINASSSSDNDISEDSSASSRNIKEYETSDCDESTDSIDSLNSSAIQQMSEEEALDYIQYLRQKIQKIEAVLQARKKSSCLNKESESKGQNVGCNIAVENSFKYAEKETFGNDEKRKVTSESSKTSIRKDSTAIINNNSKGKSKKPSNYIYSSRIDEEFEYAMSLTKKPQRRKRSKTHQKGKGASALRIFQQIRTFLQSDNKKFYTFPSLSRHLRFAVHKYAEACGIPSQSHGKEGKRTITVTRSRRWKIPDEETEKSILEDIGLASKQEKKKNKGKSKRKPRKANVAAAPATTYSARGRKELEKSLAVTITEDNVGHRYVRTSCSTPS